MGAAVVGGAVVVSSSLSLPQPANAPITRTRARVSAKILKIEFFLSFANGIIPFAYLNPKFNKMQNLGIKSWILCIYCNICYGKNKGYCVNNT